MPVFTFRQTIRVRFADKPLTICDLSVTAPNVSDSQANQAESRDNKRPDLLQAADGAEIRDVD